MHQKDPGRPGGKKTKTKTKKKNPKILTKRRRALGRSFTTGFKTGPPLHKPGTLGTLSPPPCMQWNVTWRNCLTWLYGSNAVHTHPGTTAHHSQRRPARWLHRNPDENQFRGKRTSDTSGRNVNYHSQDGEHHGRFLNTEELRDPTPAPASAGKGHSKSLKHFDVHCGTCQEQR